MEKMATACKCGSSIASVHDSKDKASKNRGKTPLCVERSHLNCVKCIGRDA